ncbi:putative UDP-galactose 4-epimerase [Lentisphaera araneosa HTCC2155]|uniref:Putative UDP-galactose 4-epimerase n=1 Tax=Lentisphaera araneosa HTCC2155 TaxID=313628 RepID=A6DQH1_9BACT|nr:NAD(P)-dependent oxidoreductase [Lentisphaera araneosa]EDM26052.1 putative UDP-galactose 4-epimerase [Lentisphaera araneosa HTCC2155]
MIKICIIFGGAGYIGTNLTKHFQDLKLFDKIIIADIKKSDIYDPSNNEFFECDVRKAIHYEFKDEIDFANSWIVNLAAIHREPGHEREEYFDTNICGAENINLFMEHYGFQNLIFTSSIAPYGRSLDQRCEKSQLYAETPYGISKALAEKIHQNWMYQEKNRKLIIIRPSVIYGPKDPGNILRMIKSVKKGTFFFPGKSREIIKGYGYIFGLVESISFAMKHKDTLIIYNYAENPLLKLGEMCDVIRNKFNIKRPILQIPSWPLLILAYFIQIVSKITKTSSSIHPTRVKKAGFPTNIKPSWLIENGFEFKYSFEESIQHWEKISSEDFE